VQASGNVTMRSCYDTKTDADGRGPCLDQLYQGGVMVDQLLFVRPKGVTPLISSFAGIPLEKIRPAIVALGSAWHQICQVSCSALRSHVLVFFFLSRGQPLL